MKGEITDKLCPTCKRVRIDLDQSECWDCWHAFLASLTPPKFCSSPDCPEHRFRLPLWERIRNWFMWRQLRKVEEKHAEIHDRSTYGVNNVRPPR